MQEKIWRQKGFERSSLKFCAPMIKFFACDKEALASTLIMVAKVNVPTAKIKIQMGNATAS